MSEESKYIDQLLSKDSSDAQQKSALKWLSDYCEENYILNLPPSRKVIYALEDFTEQKKAPAALKKKAKKLCEKYDV